MVDFMPRCPEITLGAAMRKIADWLPKLGLRQYANYFIKNDTALSSSLDLNGQDLEKISVAPLNHRRSDRALRRSSILAILQRVIPVP